jgi:adhesin transport system outer membrane protein
VRGEGRTNRPALDGAALAVLLAIALPYAAGCSLGSQLTKPQGDGGWSAEKRREELSMRAELAGVDFAGAGSESTATPAMVGARAEPPSFPPDRPLTLAQALVLAGKGNRRIAEGEKELERARYQVWNARGRLLPQTTASARYTWYTDPLTNQVNVGGAGAEDINPTVTIREDEAGTLGGLVTVPLDLTGELRHALAAAQAGYRGEEARLWATTLDEEVAVVSAYLNMLSAQRLREVTQETIKAQQRQLKSAEARHRGGRATKNDVLVVRVRLSSTEQRLVREDLMLDRARLALNQLVGLPVNASTVVADITDLPVVPAEEESLRTTWERNPLIVSRIEEQQRLDETVVSLERSRLPRFSAGGAFDWTSSDIIQPQDVGSGFVGLTWDLGTDWRRESDISAARVASERNRIALEREMRALEANVRLARQAVEERLSALAAARAAVAQAEENLRIREQQFNVGRATSDDVLTAVSLLARERATSATALYQAHARAAELQQLMGLPIDSASSPGQ